MKVHAVAYTLAAMFDVFGTCWAQAPTQHIRHAKPVAHRRHVRVPPPLSQTYYGACSNGNDFVAKKVQLLNSFDLQRNGASGQGGTYAEPTANPSGPTPTQTLLLADAWNIAPTYLQETLCRDVDWVFIDPDNQAPWGWSYWEEATLKQGTGGGNGLNTGNGVFIGIGANLLAGAQSGSLSVSQLEFDLVRRLFTTATPTLITNIQVTVKNPNNTAQEAVLSVLAREMGFVTEHELTKAAGGFPPCTGGANPFAQSFYHTSWNEFDDPKPEIGRIHMLGTPTDGLTPINSPPTLTQILDEVSSNKGPMAIADVKGIYEGNATNKAEWVDFMATRAPIEDFVETFRLWELSNAQGNDISKIQVTFGDGSTTDVLYNLTNASAGTPLNDKKTCMTTLLGNILQKPPT